MRLLQGEPFGRKTTLKKPLAANTSLGTKGSSHSGRAEPRVGARGLSDLLQNLENSLFDCRGRLLSVHPTGELTNALVPVPLRLVVRAPGDM